MLAAPRRSGAIAPFLALALASTAALHAREAHAQNSATPSATGTATPAAQPSASGSGAAQTPAGGSSQAPASGAAESTGGSEAANDPARVAFQQGLEALADARYAEALAAFERSYAVRRVASVALNLGITLRALGRYVEARRRFREFFEMATDAQHARHDADVRTYLAEINARIGHIHIDERVPATATLSVDGHVTALDPTGDLEVDPGEHRIEGDAPGYEPYRETVHIERSGRSHMRVVLAPRVGDPRVSLGNGGQQGGRRDNGITSQWWFWTGVSVVVLAGIFIPVGVVSSQGTDIPANWPRPAVGAIHRSAP